MSITSRREGRQDSTDVLDIVELLSTLTSLSSRRAFNLTIARSRRVEAGLQAGLHHAGKPRRRWRCPRARQMSAIGTEEMID